MEIKEIDRLISALCRYIMTLIENNSPAAANEIAKNISSLAELITARELQI